jgi:UDP-glucose 4-epimerase
MKILIVGCNGFIGSRAMKYFSDKNFEVYGTNLKITANAQTPESLNLNELFQQSKYDVCINASGSSTVKYSILYPNDDYQLNYKNVAILLELLKLHQPHCKFINLSSAAVYGNPQALPISESTPTNPISPYGKHKLLSEQLLLKYYINFNIPTLSLRIFSVYGNGLQKQLFWDIYQKSQKSTQIELYGTGNETRDFIHIDDLMLALEKIIISAQFTGNSINVASGNEISIKNAAHTLIKYLYPACKINFSGINNNIDPNFWQADISLLKGLGFLPEITLEEGLQKYASWLKELN